ncbi:hypothetical protein [Allobranchiibius sp. GilTou73]|uniref:hypothetical protein n=1 Tax=Allobranchiibius sp. GilTou73 TaxID=2904523 RepID=UPI001F1E83BB|nr:hypothetical protein [Allobranchiibius sp. GilTou73]UIJ36225.1 hypothetical protein LVQ62_07615 [Allobranchiibius sp. GilTou73]
MAPDSPLTSLESWLFHHHRQVRLGCAAFIVVAVVWALYLLANGLVGDAVVAVASCGGPVALLAGTRAIEQRVTQRDVVEHVGPTS